MWSQHRNSREASKGRDRFKCAVSFLVAYIYALSTMRFFHPERSISCKSVKAPLPLSTPTTSNAANHQTPDTDIVYDAPCKISPTSNSSVCSIFSGSDSHNHYRHHNHRYSRVLSNAQPYETPLVTPRNSRQTLFASNSTLNTITGSEVIVSKTTPVHTQPVPPGTMTLDRLRRVKLKKPLPVVKPAALISATKPITHLQIPERGGREKPSSTVSDRPPKPNAPTPEPPNNTEHSQDEGYCTARHPVKLLHEVTNFYKCLFISILYIQNPFLYTFERL